MNILVTGGAGFIGSNFILHIMKKNPDYKVVCLDCLTYAADINSLSQVINNPAFKFIKADIRDKAAVEKIFSEYKPDSVINFAAETHVDRSITDSSVFVDTNIKGVQILLEACRRYSTKRFHQISTDEVYGGVDSKSTDIVFNEKSPLNPSNPYAATKAAADLLTLSFSKTYGLPVIISRCCNNYGPSQHSEKLIPLVISNAVQNKKIPVYGTGENIRNWIYVKDHCEALEMIINKGKTGEIYNIGSRNELKNTDTVKSVLDILQKPYSLIEYTKDRPSHDEKYPLDFSKTENEIGFTPATSFATGIRKTVEWYLNNKDFSKNKKYRTD